MTWDRRLEEFEMCYDGSALWKFGPVSLSDSIGIHAVFSTVASKRVMRGQESQGEDSDGSQQSDPPPCYDAEMDDDHLPDIQEDEEPVWMTHLHEVTDSEDEGNQEDGHLMPFSLGVSRYSGGRTNWLSPMQRGAA